MLPQFPFLVLGQTSSAKDALRNTPVMFLAILDVAAHGFCEIEILRKIRKLLVQTYATCSLGTGASSIPLLQALVISAVWHKTITPPEPGEHLDVCHISHTAANMAIMRGLGKSLTTQSWKGPVPIQNHRLRGPSSKYQASSLETRRTWLACHYICSHTSMALQNPNIMRWTRCMDECLEVLEMSPASSLSDKDLCLHIRLQHIVEDLEVQPSSSTLRSTAAEVTHKAFKRRLADWAASPQVCHDTLKFSHQFAALYMHEIAMCAGLINDQAMDLDAPGRAPIDTAHFVDCVAAAHGVIDIILSMGMSRIRALPTVYLVRLMYASVLLVKLHFAASRIIDIEEAVRKTVELKVEDYLSRLLQKWGTLWPAWKLTKDLRRIRDLFRQSNDIATRTSESAWLDHWAFKMPSNDQQIGHNAAQTRQTAVSLPLGAAQSDFDSLQLFEEQPVRYPSEPAPAVQMLPVSVANDALWNHQPTSFGDGVPHPMDDMLPCMNLGDSLSWDSTQLDKWLNTNINTSTFDFDGDLQYSIPFP